MIKVSEDFGDVLNISWGDYYGEIPPNDLCPAVNMQAVACSIHMLKASAGAAEIVFPDGTRLSRRRMYGVAPIVQEADCAQEIIAAIWRKHGPGKMWWCRKDPVARLGEDLGCRLVRVDGEPHIILGCHYFFRPEPKMVGLAELDAREQFTPVGRIQAVADMEREGVITREQGRSLLEMPLRMPDPARLRDFHAAIDKYNSVSVDPLDVKYDGKTLRLLIEEDEIGRREGPSFMMEMFHIARGQVTPAQRVALSAHWSSRLRAKIAESSAKDRNKVTYCEED